MKQAVRWVALLLGLLIMGFTVMIPEYARLRFTLPLTLAIGFLAARWYTSQPQPQLQKLWRACSESARIYYGVPLCLTLMLSLLPSLFRGHFPYPSNHDELSYHLAADTFCHGRLANPTPAGWEHFESYHINVVPAYCSKYQPGMGLMLAVGQLLGHTYLGVILALLGATQAMSCAYRQWLPIRWAFFASMLSCFPLCANWSDCYFVGGPLAATATAVLLWYARQLEQRAATWKDGLGLAGCLALFFWTRPFEGAVVATFIGVPLLCRQISRHGMPVLFKQLLPGSLLVLIPVLWFQASFNHACTGSYTKLPYLLHEQQYGGTPLFLVQPVRAEMPRYQHQRLENFNNQMLDWYQIQHDPNRMAHAYLFKFGTAWINFYCLLWLLPLGVLPELLALPTARRLLLNWTILLALLIGMTTWFLHHYAAPALPIWTLAIVMSIRLVRPYTIKRLPAGTFLIVMLVTAYCSQILIDLSMTSIYSNPGWIEQRQHILNDLSQQGRQHLIFVEYVDQEDTGKEWVYNLADLEIQPVLWARSMGKTKDAVLAEKYPYRMYWLLTVDGKDKSKPTELKPYLP